MFRAAVARLAKVVDRGHGFAASSGGAAAARADSPSGRATACRSIARGEYSSGADWPALWWINRHAVADRR